MPEFVRDLNIDKVTCPKGNILSRKSTKKNGSARYVKKAACRKCEVFKSCYHGKGKWKEIDFAPGQIRVTCRNWGETTK